MTTSGDKLTFLNEPAGVAPNPMVPAHVEVQVRAATDLAATRARLARASDIWPPADAASVQAFLAAHRRWYAPLDAVRRARDALKAGQPEPALEPAEPTLPAPALRARFPGPEALRREELLSLVPGGARGNLVLWFPAAEIRKRLVGGGVAGLWRGVTRFRDGLPGAGPQLGGTPVFIMGAIPALDAPLLGGAPPVGFSAIVSADAWLGPAGEREERLSLARELGEAPPAAADLPDAWKALFRAPDGTDVVWLVPSSTDVMGGAVDAAVDSLAPLVKQGAKAWLLLALPLGEERKPERF